MGLLIPLLAFAKAAEAIISRQKIKVQKWWRRKKKKPKSREDNNVL